MSPKGSIDARQLWKRFHADRRRRLLRDQIEYLRALARGRATRGWRWALRGVDFVVEPGESVGLVGPNGSGKSTLLKILTGVMYPYAGSIDVVGRVGALIEVRAGLHPDLTGRENVFFYGSLLGLPRREVARRFDEIVGFAELEQAIDRQVKFYSSGMQMRLGFAVAAYLEPDILLVDEALSVGDGAFQQKCLDRMRAVLAEGTTLVYVSHDLASVEATTSRGVWLSDGEVRADGPVHDVLGAYRSDFEESLESSRRQPGLVTLMKVTTGGGDSGPIRTQGPLDVCLVIESEKMRTGQIYLGVSQSLATPIFSIRRDMQLHAGETEIRCSIDHLPLPRGRYYLWVGVWQSAKRDLLPWHAATQFDVVGPGLDPAPRAVVRLAPVHVEARWEAEAR